MPEMPRETIGTAGPGSGFILSTSDSIRDGTPLENVQAYFAACRESGQYPMRSMIRALRTSAAYARSSTS